ncbi:MAG: nuclease-related domain-containing protein [Streptosporangiaceae bacterium]
MRCPQCPASATTPAAADAAPAPGTAGASARREFERRKAAWEQQIQARHPRLGKIILAISDQPRSTRAWATGAAGEVRLGARLDRLTGPPARVLHDRRIPGTRANIDHIMVCRIMVCRAGVFVIDAKRYSGRPHLKADGGFWQEHTEKLMVGSRDHTALADGVLRQVASIRSVLGHDPQLPIRGFLCFIDADWPLTGRAIRTVTVLWPKNLASIITGPGPLSEASIAAAHQRLAAAFPSA